MKLHEELNNSKNLNTHMKHDITHFKCNGRIGSGKIMRSIHDIEKEDPQIAYQRKIIREEYM